MNRVGGSRARWTGKPARVGASGGAAINYREALSWLYSLQRFGIKLGLENIQRLLEELSKSHILQLLIGKSFTSRERMAKVPFVP